MAKQTPDQCTSAAWKFVVDLKVSKYPSRLSVASVYSSRRRVPNHLSLILGSLVSFFPGSLVSFFSGHWCLFASFAATVSSESPFKLFLATSGLSVWVYSFWGFGLGVLLCSFIRVSVWVCSFSAFRLGLLLLGFRAPFAPLRDRALLFLMFRSGYTLFSLLLCSFILVSVGVYRF